MRPSNNVRIMTSIILLGRVFAIRAGFVIGLMATVAAVAQAAERPNVLWISCEDISAHLGCYGDPHAITPNLDRLAEQGVRYTHAFTAAGVCAPNRSTIITGMYQNSIGTHHMRCDAKLPTWLRPFPMLLREAGYYCTNNSKTDYQFSEPSPKSIWDESGGKAHWKNHADPDQPFFAVFNFTGCHESGIANRNKYETVTKGLTAAQRQDPDSLTTLPPYYPDTPVVREDWKRNYELITAMDAWAGDLILQVKEAGLWEDTIVFFWSDHGVGLPRAKRWLYDSGTRVPLIARIPPQHRTQRQGRPGTVDSQLVNSVDFGPTVLRMAGVAVPEYVQGRAFLGDALTPPRDYVYGARDRMDERYDIIRTVRNQRFRYVRNFEPLKPYYQYMNTPEKGATMREIRRAETEGTLTDVMALFSAPTKPVEELYDCESDPHEVNNLADDPAHASTLSAMRRALSLWQNDVGDLGLIPEAEIEVREPIAGSCYGILRQSEDAVDSLTRLVQMATRASSGSSALDSLIEGLHDEDPAIRYWAATGIGNIGPGADRALSAVTRTLGDASPSVRIASARAVARLGRVDAALGVLQGELTGPHQWARLAAAIVLDEMDADAKPAAEALRAALKDQPNKYIVRVANRALNELEGTGNVVP